MNKKILKSFLLWWSVYLFLTLVFSISGFFGKNYSMADTLEKETEKEITLKRNSGDLKLPIETYLFGVVAAEMPASFETEALKAQAVAARTYTYSKIGKNLPEHPNCDVCDDINHCKAYLSEEELKEKYGDDWIKNHYPKIKKAVEETKGVIATYNGEPITAVFHSTSSGMTENSKDVWSGDVPYLVSVVSEGEQESPKYSDSVIFTVDDFKNKISQSGEKLNFENLIGEIKRNESGSVNTIIIGGVRFKGTKVRELLGLRSTNFEIELGDMVKITTKGNGHGVGMSQYGANYMAKMGYTYEQILKKYYTGISLSGV